MIWALVIVMTWETAPAVSWHPSFEACQTQAAIELQHAITQGRDVSYVRCESHRRPRLRPITGELR